MSHADTQPVPSVIPGISLRDYFAGCAITGLLVDAALSKVKVVTFAYEVADAMLEQREKPLNGGDSSVYGINPVEFWKTHERAGE